MRWLADAVNLEKPIAYEKVNRRLAGNPIEACRLDPVVALRRR